MKVPTDLFSKIPRLPPSWRRIDLNWWLWGVFAVLVLGGFTGSSLGWYKTYPGVSGMIELVGERKLAGVYRGIRGDEFIAHGTPTALAQVHHQPRFPRLNENIGLDGRNFLVLHDLGAPVLHPSTLARPATWGFFIFDLRRALAWYWFFPIFLGIWGIWFFLNTLWPEQRGVNLLLSAAAAFSPYSAAWSFWPVNHAAGLCIAAAAALRLLAASGWRARLGWAALAGWAAAAAAMSLYVPRLWPIATLLLAVGIGAVWQDKRFRSRFDAGTVAAFACAALTAGLLLGSWYRGAEAAIRTIRESVYPGGRRLNGGSMEWWELAKGWLAPLTIYKIQFSSQSEMQAPLTLLFPFLLYIGRFRASLKQNAVVYAIAAFAVFALVYQYVGLPAWLGRLTFWDHGNPPRAGMALTMAQLFLIGAFWHDRSGAPPAPRRDRCGRDAALALLSAAPMLLLLSAAPSGLAAGLLVFFPKFVLVAAGAVIAGIYVLCAYWLLHDLRKFVWFFAGFNIALGAVFNPVCLAPTRIENKLAALTAAEPDLSFQGRMLFATGNDFLPVAWSLAGGRVFNGYFMYEDRAIYELLYRELDRPERFHRMNHLDADIAPPGSPLFEAEIPYNDRILLRFNGRDYDFSQLPVDFLVVPSARRGDLAGNASLEYRRTLDTLDYFRVRRRPIPVK